MILSLSVSLNMESDGRWVGILEDFDLEDSVDGVVVDDDFEEREDLDQVVEGSEGGNECNRKHVE